MENWSMSHRFAKGTVLLLMALCVFAGSACNPGPTPSRDRGPSSVADAKTRLERKGWTIKELGGGVKFLAKDRYFDDYEAMEAYAKNKRGQINGVVFVSPTDDSVLSFGLSRRRRRPDGRTDHWTLFTFAGGGWASRTGGPGKASTFVCDKMTGRRHD
jgi:hypothetical protein